MESLYPFVDLGTTVPDIGSKKKEICRFPFSYLKFVRHNGAMPTWNVSIMNGQKSVLGTFQYDLQRVAAL